jgi:hypothetical protein
MFMVKNRTTIGEFFKSTQSLLLILVLQLGLNKQKIKSPDKVDYQL